MGLSRQVVTVCPDLGVGNKGSVSEDQLIIVTSDTANRSGGLRGLNLVDRNRVIALTHLEGTSGSNGSRKRHIVIASTQVGGLRAVAPSVMASAAELPVKATFAPSAGVMVTPPVDSAALLVVSAPAASAEMVD